MKIVYTVVINKATGHPIRTPYYRLRPALAYGRWLLSLYRKGGRFSVRVSVSQTPPQEAWSWLTRMVRVGWSRKDPRYTVVAYDVHRYCADMIEGGRWFNTYTLEESRKCWRKATAFRLMDEMAEEFAYTGQRYSVLGGDDCDVRYLDRFEANPKFIDTYQPYE
jgi:hypothetical protein